MFTGLNSDSHTSGHTKMLHTSVGMGSTALVAAIALPSYGNLN